MSRTSILLLFALLAVAAAVPHTVRRREQDPEPSFSPEESLEPSVSPDPDGDNEVCVDEKFLLARFPKHQLVHTAPLLASTLCPGGSLPCGTANHMVRLNGKPISYRQLCEQRECDKKNLLVNSVLSHVWQETEQDGVVLTMFDARHPELPQMAFHWAVAQKRRVFG